MSQHGTRFWSISKPGLILAAAICVGLCSRAQPIATAAETPFEAELRLRQAATSAPNNVAAQRTYAEFLDRYRSHDARAAYTKLADALIRSNAPAAERAAVAEKLTLLDLLAGDREAATSHLAIYNQAGGTGLTLPSRAAPQASESIQIPGPLRSFARMAAISTDLAPDEILPALARTVVINGYRAQSLGDGLEQTEYLSLVLRYLTQARELESLAGTDKMIRITQCDSTETGVLLRIIGYRIRGGCGAEVVLETINASRAFLTTDSGFPLGQLELALRTNKPFVLDYHPTQVPILYTRAYWQPAKDQTDQPFIDYLVSDPSLARLYVGISKIDPETADALKTAMPAPRLKLYAHVLDFYGAMFRIRNGRAIVPGGSRTERAWEKLNGVSVDKGSAFFEKLLMQDDGWLASYYDALARIHGPVQNYLLDPDRVQRFYDAIRGKVTTPGPARPVFRSNTDMLLLTTRLRLDPDGRPHLPGGLETWKHLFTDPPKNSKTDGKIKKDAPTWKDPDQVLEALFGLSRKLAENDHLKIFMALTDLDRRRTQPLEPAVVEQLARRYNDMSAQYSILAEAPTLHGPTMIAFLDAAERIGEVRNQSRRSDALGLFQGLTSLWQIFLRQGVLPPDQADASLTTIVAAFANPDNDRQLFDAGRTGIQTLLRATQSPASKSAQAAKFQEKSQEKLQDQMIDRLAGTTAPSGSNSYQRMARDLIRVFEAQRLVSLDTIFDLADNLEGVAKGQPLNAAAVGRLANRLAEIQLPTGDLTRAEKNVNSYGYWADRHVEDQRKSTLRRDIEKAAANPQELADLRGALTPYLRDTLVGFNYMHYAPPGAQILHTNPLFVRSHDFIGYSNTNRSWSPTELYGSGWPHNAGGRLSGSLAGLPYALAQAEQNFLVPTKTQALIWSDLVPQMLLTAVVPRFWNVSQDQVHWVGLHMAYGESLLAEAALNPQRRAQVLETLDLHLSPRRIKTVEDALASGDVVDALANVLPSELYLLARALSASESNAANATLAEIRRLSAANPRELSDDRISRAFGTPKPTLANSYEPELLNLRTFPTLMGYSTRILAESWESNLLYYAALADQIHATSDDLNILVPEWTQMTVENIFATHLEDWPALLRSLRTVGDQVRKAADTQALAGTAYFPGGDAQ